MIILYIHFPVVDLHRRELLNMAFVSYWYFLTNRFNSLNLKVRICRRVSSCFCFAVVAFCECRADAVGIELLAAVVCCQTYLKHTGILAVASSVTNNYFTVGSLPAYKWCQIQHLRNNTLSCCEVLPCFTDTFHSEVGLLESGNEDLLA